jgi:hypothetical protein
MHEPERKGGRDLLDPALPDNIDLADFCSLLAQAMPGSEIAQGCQKTIDALQSAYVIAQGYQGADLMNSKGMAIYFPTRSVSPLYDKLENVVVPMFYRDRDRFLNIMVHAIALNGSFFNTQRMIQQYVLKAYFE